MPNPLPLFLSYIAICCFPVFAVTGFILFKKKEYPLTSTLLILGACLSIFMGYAVIAVIMLRFVHDISAFCIYVKHDTLFLSKNKKNYLYSLFRIQAKYVYVFLPVFSIFISYFLQVKGNIFVTFIVLLLALNHYYLESVIWKRGSLHREMLR